MTAASLFTANDSSIASSHHTSGDLHVFDSPAVSYEIVGPRAGPVVAVLGGISATKHVTASPSDHHRWWKTWLDQVEQSTRGTSGFSPSTTLRREAAAVRYDVRSGILLAAASTRSAYPRPTSGRAS